MSRVKRAVSARKAKNKIFKLAKGYRGSRSRAYRSAKDSVQRAMLYAYRDRRTKKRDFRRLWIVRINAAARENDMTYSDFICGLKKGQIELSRKTLAALAYDDSAAFTTLVTKAKDALQAKSA